MWTGVDIGAGCSAVPDSHKLRIHRFLGDDTATSQLVDGCDRKGDLVPGGPVELRSLHGSDSTRSGAWRTGGLVSRRAKRNWRPNSNLEPAVSLSPGDLAPDFTLDSDDAGSISLRNLRGQRVVLYFYPKDSTPGCTTQACDFRDLKADFAASNAVVLGVSKDSLKSHGNFRAKQSLNFPLLSDPELELGARRRTTGRPTWGRSVRP